MPATNIWPLTQAVDKPEISISTTPTALVPYEIYRVDTTTSTGTDPDPAGDGSVPSLNYVAHTVADGTVQGQLFTVHQQGANAVRIEGKVDGNLDHIYQNADGSRVTYSWDVPSDTWESSNTNFIVGGGGSGTVDTALSDTSTNAVENRVVKAAIDAVVAGGVVIDAALSLTSTNPVENRAISNTLASDTGTVNINGGTF